MPPTSARNLDPADPPDRRRGLTLVPPAKPGEPDWCAGGDHTTAQGLRHRSEPVDVGDRHEGGSVRAWLIQRFGCAERVAVNTALATGVTADIGLDDAVNLRDGLNWILRQAGRE